MGSTFKDMRTTASSYSLAFLKYKVLYPLRIGTQFRRYLSLILMFNVKKSKMV